MLYAFEGILFFFAVAFGLFGVILHHPPWNLKIICLFSGFKPLEDVSVCVSCVKIDVVSATVEIFIKDPLAYGNNNEYKWWIVGAEHWRCKTERRVWEKKMCVNKGTSYWELKNWGVRCLGDSRLCLLLTLKYLRPKFNRWLLSHMSTRAHPTNKEITLLGSCCIKSLLFSLNPASVWGLIMIPPHRQNKGSLICDIKSNKMFFFPLNDLLHNGPFGSTIANKWVH